MSTGPPGATAPVFVNDDNLDTAGHAPDTPLGLGAT